MGKERKESMRVINNEYKFIYDGVQHIFDYLYERAGNSHQNDSVIDDIVESVNKFGIAERWPDYELGKIIGVKVVELLDKWKSNRDELRSRGAGMNRESIPIMKRDILKIIEKADDFRRSGH